MRLTPSYYFNSLAEVPVALLLEHGVDVVLLDKDNTLTFDTKAELLPGAGEWLKKARASGLTPVILSNNIEENVKAAAGLMGAEYISAAKKPGLSSLPRIVEAYGAADKIAVIGDQLFTDIWFANRAKMLSILVKPYGEDIPFSIKIKRVLEKPFVKRLKEGCDGTAR